MVRFAVALVLPFLLDLWDATSACNGLTLVTNTFQISHKGEKKTKEVQNLTY